MLGRAGGRHVWAPGDHLHAKGLAHLGHPSTNLSQPNEAKGFTLQHLAKAWVMQPRSPARVGIAKGEEAWLQALRRREDEGPGELTGAGLGGAELGVEDRDVAGLAGGFIEQCVAQTRVDDELEVRRHRELGLSYGRAISHEHEAIGAMQCLGQGLAAKWLGVHLQPGTA